MQDGMHRAIVARPPPVSPVNRDPVVPAEFTYLSQLARSYLSGRTNSPVPSAGLDWEELVRLILAQNLATSLGPLIVDGPAPESVKDRLESRIRKLYRWNALLWFESTRFLLALSEAGIDGILLKGLALARTVYSRPEHRTSIDIDVYVPRSSLDEARQVLGGLGYVMSRTKRHATFYEQHHFHLIFENANKVVIELHWHLSKPEDYCRFDLDGFIARSRSIELDGMWVRIPSDEDQVLHAAYQSLCDGYVDLRRVLDAALLFRRGWVDPTLLAKLARRQGMASCLWVLLDLQRNTLGQAIPPELEEAVKPVAVVRRGLERLDLTVRSGARDAAERTGFKKLVRCLCAPDYAAAFLELKRYVCVDRGQWLDMGYDPEDPPGRMWRLSLGARRCFSLVKLIGYQGLRRIDG